MKKVIGVISTIVSAGIAIFAGKLVYDILSDKKRREEFDREFLDNIDDDFTYFSEATVEKVADPKPVSEPKTTIPEASKKTTVPEASKKTTVPEASKKTTVPEASKKTGVSQTAKKDNATSSASKGVPNKKTTEQKDGITCQDVIDCTADVLGVSAEDILSKSRKGEVANARRVAIYLCATNLGVSNATICEEFGGIGATSVSNAKKNVAEKIKSDDALAADVEDITDEIKQLEKSFKR